eukprot:snap_masked-scaffold_8-processed-gene-5.14-mRNA-1 protein AED:0.45 eAED:0.47 QI:0/0/0/0.5/1/1/2/0/536
MSRLSPVGVYIKPRAQPFNNKPHPVTGEKKKLLEKKLKDLESIGALERDPNPYSSSPVFVVPKPQKNKFRVVIDLTRLNRNTEANTGCLPRWKTQFSWLPKGCKHFGLYDALSGFDMLRITPESEKYFGISTMMGVYRLKCAPMSYHITPFIYSERIISEVLNVEESHLFGAARSGILQWLEDSLLYSLTWKGFLETTETFLKRCRQRFLRLNLLKYELYSNSPTWCGRVITPTGWMFSQKHYNKIRQISRPLNIGHQGTVLYISNWLSTNIPKYAETRQALWERLQELTLLLTTEKQRKNKKRRKEVSIKEVWTDADQELLKNLKRFIEDSCRKQLTNYDPKQMIGLFSDVSDLHWSSVLVCKQLLNEPWKPTFFLSGILPHFTNLTRFMYFLLGHPSPNKIYTDHNNLIGLFDVGSNQKIVEVGRLHRLKLLVQEFNLEFEHIPGQENTVADFLSRWGYGEEAEMQEKRIMEETFPVQIDGLLSNTPKKQIVQILGKRATAAKVTSAERFVRNTEYNDFLKARISYLFPDRYPL